MTQSINEIASKHLGKAGDGSVVKPYVTPESVDSSLLVAVPRHLNRVQYGIDDDNLKFCGYDTWNCYEVSFLLENGFPVAGVVKLQYSCDSESIVESKSLKLYLNSFNMEKFSTSNEFEAINSVKTRIADDLKSVLKTDVAVHFHRSEHLVYKKKFDVLEEVVNYKNLVFDAFNEDPDLLVPSIKQKISVSSSLLRSNCRVTNQPDWGDVYIYMEAQSTPTYESLLQYIISMRKENHFHEEICECIYQRLYDKFSPEVLVVGCLYTRRGGIDINPIRATNKGDMNLIFSDYLNVHQIYKTLRQ